MVTSFIVVVVVVMLMIVVMVMMHYTRTVHWFFIHDKTPNNESARKIQYRIQAGFFK